jgi:hypothetical protein
MHRPKQMRIVECAFALMVTLIPAWMASRQSWGTPAAAQGQGRGGQAGNPFPGGTNPDGSLRPTPPLARLFTQDPYTEYSILAPGSEQFRIRYLPEETRAGATELVNATRGGSEGSEIEVYDPRPQSIGIKPIVCGSVRPRPDCSSRTTITAASAPRLPDR